MPMTVIEANFTSKSYVSFWYCKQCDCGIVLQASFIIKNGHCPDCMGILEPSTNVRSISSYITLEVVEVEPSKKHGPN